MASYTQGWYFTKKELMKPVREGGTDWETAIKYRQAMYLFITKIGRLLQLPQLTQSTSEVYFHRFFARRDFLDHDRHVIATACLFLATKVEEVHRKLRDVLLHSYEIQNGDKLLQDSDKYNTFRQQVLVAERLVLQTIAFDLTVEHPHRFLQEHGTVIACKEEERKKLIQTAWYFVNDSFASTVCLQYRPQLIAAAAIYLAAKNLKIELKSNTDKEWWQNANIKPEELTDTTTQILEAFPTPEPSSSSGNTSNAESPTNGSASMNDSDVPPGQRIKRKEPDSVAPTAP